MKIILTMLTYFMLMPTSAQQSARNNTLPSAELLEFLAEFNMHNEHSDNDYDLIQHHALQDLKTTSKQEQDNDY